MHWMNMSVTIGSISAALLGVSGHAHKNWGSDYVKQAVAVRILALTMMLIGISMAIYAAINFRIRGNMLLYVLVVQGGAAVHPPPQCKDGRSVRQPRAPSPALPGHDYVFGRGVCWHPGRLCRMNTSSIMTLA